MTENFKCDFNFVFNTPDRFRKAPMDIERVKLLDNT